MTPQFSRICDIGDQGDCTAGPGDAIRVADARAERQWISRVFSTGACSYSTIRPDGL